MRRSISLCAAALLCGSTSLAAQAALPAGPMRQLDWLVGEWQGAGTMTRGPGQRVEGSIVERATSHAGGYAMTLSGLGKAAVPGGDSIVVHDAFAMLWHDADAGRFRLKTFRANGHTVDADIEVGERRIVWGFPDPRAGQIRFTVALTPEGRWHEVGEFSRDGATWMKFFEMTLSRVGKQANAAH
jgi:hypothetical protein